MRILIIEDNKELSQLIGECLTRSGFGSDRVETIDEAEDAVSAIEYAAIVLDLGLSGEDGFTFLRRLRERQTSIPVLIASARNGLDDRVKGLREGADDYLVKPFSLDELVARLRALVRRPNNFGGNVLTVGNVMLDCDKHQVNVGDRLWPMRLRETVLLDILMRHKNSVVPRRYFEDQLFGINSDQESNTLEVYIHRVRQHLMDACATVRVHNIRGVGYMLCEDKNIFSAKSDGARCMPNGSKPVVSK